MKLSSIVQTRYTTKAFDASRKLPADVIEQIEALLHHAPSSVNSQPWRFLIADSEEAKQRVARATQGVYAFNEAKIRNASHVVVFCARQRFDDQHLLALLEQEDRDGRFASSEARAGQDRGRRFFVDMHRFDKKDTQHWMEKQVYLALGTLLLGAASLGVDACPIEGFDAKALDEELGLREQGFTSVVIAALGYRSEDDFNAKLPKSRLPAEGVIRRL